MAGAGALSPDWNQSRGATFLLCLPALAGFEVMMMSMDKPHSLLPTVVSIFPLTAPFAMLARLVKGGVPLWQLLLACGLIALTTYGITRAVAAMFQAQHLLSGQPFSVRRYMRVLLGKSS